MRLSRQVVAYPITLAVHCMPFGKSNDNRLSAEEVDSDVELGHSHGPTGAVAAAVAKAAAVAQGVKGKQGATQIDATDAFLSAMAKAERQHDRQQQPADGDDAFGKLLAARKKQVCTGYALFRHV